MKRRDFLCAVAGRAVLPGLANSAPLVRSYDLIVIGSGVAGLTAAVSAIENGLRRVLVLEKTSVIGGHSILSTGYVSAVRRGGASKKEFDKAVKSFAEDFRRIGGGRNSPALYKKLARESGEAVDWLEKQGLQWESFPVQTLAGLTARSYISSPVRAGYDYVITLSKAALRSGVTIIRSARATRLSRREEAGKFDVEVNGGERVFSAPVVVLATGGFGANKELRTKYVPGLGPGYTTTADPAGKGIDPATGDGLLLARTLGAVFVDMDCVQVIPFWGGRLTDYVGADIYLTPEGRRFVNEGANWKVIAAAISKLPEGRCWVVTDSQSRQGASRSVKLMKGVVRTADTVKEMARGMGVDSGVLQETLDRYNAFVRRRRDGDFGKRMFTQEINRPPYYYGQEQLYVHYCCGGLRINDSAGVIGIDGKPIPGLYAAGEVTGGIHGEDRVGGCSITDCLVFGREASRSAARYLKGLSGRGCV